jgi:signal transduction histidine kinase
MVKFSLKNRIAFNYLLSTALLVLFVFIIIYNIVLFSVYSHVDNDLAVEANRHLSEVKITNGNLQLIDTEEWREQEHISLSVNPVFVEILNHRKQLSEKSPNLKQHHLLLTPHQQDYKPFSTMLAGKQIRQVQFKVKKSGMIAGYILIAMSLEDPTMVLKNLNTVLWISYPVILFLLFFIARLIAGRNIRPVQSITETARAITRDNLGSRIQMPQHKDELYVLSRTINELLERIENAIVREKQFTSDASHELRTPLAVLKGTLEVLIRKPRDKQEYEEKIKFCINEVDRLNNLIDQLLLLARFENQKIAINKQSIELDDLILQSLERFSSEIERRQITIDFSFDEHFYIVSDWYMISTIIENLLSNALKYSHDKGQIGILLYRENESVCCKITDNGIGIPKEDLDKIYEQFYRSQAIVHAPIKGTGLGLSIVKRLCDLLSIDIKIESVEQVGTKVNIQFPQ